ncbi:hypothetical protein Sta7437_3455 [Stanieria cyanosphaera PCC 7437]|uniref:Glycosyltransferase RgtA/B/C/D-like domain-containing protein n=1 Tax=Stanieria cyanosphaera (strain ATCC 29371 / PCC 7437) TaxID=111780 RepID=K9XXX6_STAC7|nr:hypothetical protein [Stanieria cyanosphaera]AFZ36956.1 hypothetical protein Sta7437_3455 [Stanieria cyanosphaera PCC 7437]
MKKSSIHLLLLLGWIALGTALRFTNLESKPPWSDEWATLVFSLGNSFRTVPLDQVIELETLLSPLQLNPAQQTQDVIHHLLTESTHPPFYFVVNHWWLKLFSPDVGLVSIWLGRALSSCLGIVAIPVMFGCSWLLFRSLIICQLAAALMAISPYGVYLSQEARHYTLVIIWVIFSLTFLTIAVRHLGQQKSISLSLVLSWIVVNGLGVATHYFFCLTLVTEIVVLFGFWWRDFRKNPKNILNNYWSKIYLAIIGTIISCSVWIHTWRSIPDNQLTSWVFNENPLAQFFEPILRLLVWLITMVFLLPIEGVADWVSIASGAIILALLIWLVPTWIRNFKQNQKLQSINLSTRVLWRFVLSAIALILVITFVFKADLTLSARFQFFYYPVILLLFSVILSIYWQQPNQKNYWFKPQGKKVIGITILMGILGSLTITNNYAFQKVERPDLVVPVMIEAYQQVAPQTPVIIATLHQTHGQTGEMMSIAWQFQELIKQNRLDFQPQFLLIHQPEKDLTIASSILQQAISATPSRGATAAIPRPFQLWLVNVSELNNLEQFQCNAETNFKRKTTGYRYQLYNCRE